MIMSQCVMCSGNSLRRELIDKVFNVDGRYVLVTGIPSKVCRNCGERSFSPEATEKARLLVHETPAGTPAKSVPMDVYEYA